MHTAQIHKPSSSNTFSDADLHLSHLVLGLIAAVIRVQPNTVPAKDVLGMARSTHHKSLVFCVKLLCMRYLFSCFEVFRPVFVVIHLHATKHEQIVYCNFSRARCCKATRWPQLSPFSKRVCVQKQRCSTLSHSHKNTRACHINTRVRTQ